MMAIASNLDSSVKRPKVILVKGPVMGVKIMLEKNEKMQQNKLQKLEDALVEQRPTTEKCLK